MNVFQASWWKGHRGEWYVIAQLALILLIIIGPTSWPEPMPWHAPFDWLGKSFGAVLMFSGIAFCLTASLRLGKSLTPLPHPRENAELTVSGPYRVVRHPIYSGLVIAAFGWALWVNGWLTLGYALLLLVFFDIKSRREETWLLARYPNYGAYRQRVRKLIPFIY